MWLVSSVTDKLGEWKDRIEEEVVSYLVGGKASVEIDIFPRGTKSKDSLVIEVRDNEVEKNMRRGIALMLLLSELVDLVELRTVIMSFIEEVDKDTLIRRIDKNMASLTCEVLANQSLTNVRDSYASYIRNVVSFPYQAHKPPIEYDKDVEFVSFVLVAPLVIPLLLSLPSVDITLFSHNNHTGLSHTLIETYIKIISMEEPIVFEKSVCALQLSNKNRVVFVKYDTSKEAIMALLK